MKIVQNRSNTCISYDAINRAFSVAKEATRLGSPKIGRAELNDFEIDVLVASLATLKALLMAS